MKTFLVAVLASILFTGCEKSVAERLEGRYSGIFFRGTWAATDNPVTSNVTLHFSTDEFSGTSSMAHYPAICNGTYKADADTLQVTNGCAFTADFSWTFVFNGTYNYTWENNRLKIWKEYPDGVKDTYVLEKVE